MTTENQFQTVAETCGANLECKNINTSRYGSDDHGLCLDCGWDWTDVLDEVEGWDDDEDEDEEYIDDGF